MIEPEAYTDAVQLRAQLDAVLAVVYLLFSQGQHVTPIRRDLCDEARRIRRMLTAQPIGDVPEVHALLALMCFHALASTCVSRLTALLFCSMNRIAPSGTGATCVRAWRGSPSQPLA